MTISRGKNPYAANDRSSEGVSQQHTNRLGQEAAQDLCKPDCNIAFKDKMSIARGDAGPNGAEMPTEKMAQAAENKDALQAMNADSDMTKQMLAINPITELFDQLKEQDRAAAVDFAVMNSEMQTHGTNTGDAAFDEEVRNRIKPIAA